MSDLKSTYELYKKMNDENIILSFKGVVSPELLSSLLQIMESKLDHMNEPPRVKKKVYNVLVESLQNLYHHTSSNLPGRSYQETLERSALVMILRQGDSFYIRTGNFIPNENIDELESRLIEINNMSKEDLRSYYRHNLENSSYSDKGTAGLGMIDIARKSGNKLDFEFLSVNNTSKFFCLNIKID